MITVVSHGIAQPYTYANVVMTDKIRKKVLVSVIDRATAENFWIEDGSDLIDMEGNIWFEGIHKPVFLCPNPLYYIYSFNNWRLI